MSERYTLHLGDNLEALRSMPDNSIDAIVTDPPYGLSFMGKKWDYDVPSVDTWRECLRVLKPGGHLLAFAGTRTQHRMAVNIEDAGFEIRDMIAWVYGSGFPKSHDVSKAIDRDAGAEREKVRVKWTENVLGGGIGIDRPWKREAAANGYHEVDGGIPATDAAKQWAGWGTALKPAMEPITVARKPLHGTVASNVLEYGTGGLNIDGCRIPTDDFNGMTAETFSGVKKGDGIWNMADKGMFDAGRRGGWLNGPPAGRWPANLIHDGSEEVMELLDSAARFFYCAKASNADRNEGLEERNKHPTVKPTDLMRYLCRLVTPPGGLILDPYMGSGSTGKAAMLEGFRFVGCEMEPEYMEIARARIAHAASQVVQEELL